MLANIEKRWEGMPPTEQAELWMALRDRMKGNWAELTLQEKKAGTWKAFPDLWSICGSPRQKGLRHVSFQRQIVQHEFGVSLNSVIRQLVLPEQLPVMSLGSVRVGPLS